MSNRLYKSSRTHEKKSTPSKWLAPATLLVIAVILSLNFLPRPRPHANWMTSTAQVSATRITTQGYRDAGEARPAEIYYRGEANVTYSANGKQYTLWIPASDNTTDRAWLSFLLSRKKDNLADVRWNPSDPSQAIATLHLR